ncbi:MAG: Ig-like domain-containing protein, partial [Elusimicrobiales bacterium]
MKHHMFTVSALFLASLCLQAATVQAAADEWAIQGYAAAAGVTGGAGGQSIVVSNLNASGPGSFRQAVQYTSGRRIVTFTPGLTGTINHPTNVYIDYNDLTIDGAGANITLSGGSINTFTSTTSKGASNIIIRNLRFADTISDHSSILVTRAASNIWIDHCTFSNNSVGTIGEPIAVWDGPGESGLPGITISWNRFNTPNKKAVLIGTGETTIVVKNTHVSLHHNWFNRVTARNPRVGGGNRTHMWNNYIYGWGEYGVGASHLADILLQNNIFEATGNATAMVLNYNGPYAASVNSSGNWYTGSPTPVEKSIGTFPMSQINYTAQLEPADAALKQRIIQGAGAHLTVPAGDTQAPVVSITAPANGSTVSGASVVVSAGASDNVGVAGVQFKLDGANLGAEDTSAPYSIVWNSLSASNGAHTITATARDAAGNTASSAGAGVTVTNAALQPDLIVTTVSYAGGVFSCTVKNQGAAATPVGTTMGVSYFVDGTQRTTGSIAGPLAAGASAAAGTTGGSYTIVGGEHTIIARADGSNVIAESNESNNELSRSITVAGALVVNVLATGASPNDSTDDTAAIQTAINRVGGTGGTVFIPDGTYMVNAVTALNLKSNMTLSLSSGAVLKAITNSETGYNIIKVSGVTNVTVSGGTLIGDRATHTGQSCTPKSGLCGDSSTDPASPIGMTGQWGMGVGIYKSSNITVKNMTARDCWGDGFYMAGSSSITVTNVVADNNRRGALSVCGADGVIVRDSILKNTHGTPPEAGVDVEPNAGEVARNLQFINCQFLNNKSDGLGLLSLTAPITNVTVDGCTMGYNKHTGMSMGEYKYPITGIRIINSNFSNNVANGLAMGGTQTGVLIDHNTAINNG